MIFNSLTRKVLGAHVSVTSFMSKSEICDKFREKCDKHYFLNSHHRCLCCHIFLKSRISYNVYQTFTKYNVHTSTQLHMYSRVTNMGLVFTPNLSWT